LRGSDPDLRDAPEASGADSFDRFQFQLLDEAGTLIAVAHLEAGRTIYDRVFPELTR
jgi:hypothetical protein